MSSLKYRDDLPESRQVRLAPVCREHLPRFAAWYSRSGFMRNLTLGQVYPLNIDDEEAWYSRVRDDPNQLAFAILHRDDNGQIGGCGVIETNWQARNTRAFVYIGDESQRGRGYGTDALAVLLRDEPAPGRPLCLLIQRGRTLPLPPPGILRRGQDAAGGMEGRGIS